MRRQLSGAIPSLVLAIGVLAMAGCAADGPQAPAAPQSPPLPPSLQAGSVLIINDAGVLEQRIVRTSLPLSVLPGRGTAPAERNLAAKCVDVGAELQLVGEVQSPVVAGNTVQANDVDVRDKLAVVAYNFAGDVFAGAIQVIDFQQPRHPVVVSEVQYRNADVNAVALQGSHVYVGLATDDPTLTTPAVLQELRLTSSGGLEVTGAWLDLPSWSVTDLAVEGDDVVAAVGARDGGLVIVRRAGTLQQTGFVAETDVRGIALDGDVVLSVCGGESSLQRHSLPGLGPLSGTPIDGLKVLASKGTIESYTHRSYLGAGEGGMQVRGADGTLLAQVRNDQWGSTDPSLAVVNAVTVSSHLGFVAAGAQGVQVVELGRYRSDDDGTHAGEAGLRVLGRLTLEDGASCNMVKAKNDILVVAAGLGGVKLVEMSFDH
jgi:hypothetical protein